MKPRIIFFVAALCLCQIVFAQPAINAGGVLNAASYAYQGLPNSGIAEGSIFVIFGTNMGGSLVTSKFPLNANLDDGTGKTTSVAITVNGTTVNALMLYASALQLAAVMPSNTPVGNGTITVTYNGQTSAPQPITVVKNSVGMFAFNQAGSGPAVVTDANYKVITQTNSAKPGQILILWATGAGPVPFDETKPPTTALDLTSQSNVQLYVGGQTVKPLYTGRSGCCSGLDQINFKVPAQGVSGCYVPVAVQTGDPVVSNFTTISVAANGGTCSDPNGLSSSDLGILQSSGELRIGVTGLIRTTSPGILGTPSSTTDGAYADFIKYDLATFEKSQGVFRSASIGGCLVFTFSGNSTQTTDPYKPVGLDAGSAISLSGLVTAQLTPVQSLTGFYNASISGDPLAAGGSATFTGPGGHDVGTFNVTVNTAPALTWTNMAQITTVHEIQGQLITWTGGDPNGTVEITGSSAGSIQPPYVGASFVCLAQTSAGQFMIPAPVLLLLPESASLPGISVPTGSLGISSLSKPVNFSATGLDLGLAFTLDATSNAVTYKQQ